MVDIKFILPDGVNYHERLSFCPNVWFRIRSNAWLVSALSLAYHHSHVQRPSRDGDPRKHNVAALQILDIDYAQLRCADQIWKN